MKKEDLLREIEDLASTLLFAKTYNKERKGVIAAYLIKFDFLIELYKKYYNDYEYANGRNFKEYQEFILR